jgi:hypothetical protein
MKFLSLLSAIVVLGSFDVGDFRNSQGISIDVDVDVVDTRDVKTIVKIIAVKRGAGGSTRLVRLDQAQAGEIGDRPL